MKKHIDNVHESFRGSSLQMGANGAVDFQTPGRLQREISVVAYDPRDLDQPLRAYRIRKNSEALGHDLFLTGAKKLGRALGGAFPLLIVEEDKTKLHEQRNRGVYHYATPNYALVHGKDNPAELQMSVETAKSVLAVLDRLDPRNANELEIPGLSARYDVEIPRFNKAARPVTNSDEKVECVGSLRFARTNDPLFMKESKVETISDLNNVIDGRHALLRYNKNEGGNVKQADLSL